VLIPRSTATRVSNLTHWLPKKHWPKKTDSWLSRHTCSNVGIQSAERTRCYGVVKHNVINQVTISVWLWINV